MRIPLLSSLVPKNRAQGSPLIHLAAVAVGSLILLLAAVSIRQTQQIHANESRLVVHNLDRLISSSLSDTFDRIDTVLLGLYDELGSDPATYPTRWPESLGLALGRISTPPLGGVRFTLCVSRLGKLGESASLPEATGCRDPALQAWMKQGQPGAPRMQLVVASGQKADGTVPAAYLLLARQLQINDPQDSGAVVAEIPVDALGQVFDDVEFGRREALTIRTSDLALVYRQPWLKVDRARVGNRETAGPLVAEVAAHPLSGVFDERSQDDGVLRTHAYRQVGRYPLLVQVTTPLPEFPQGWGTQETLVLVLALVCNGLGALLLVRMRRSGRQAVDTVRRRYEALVESSGDAIIAQSLNGRVLSWNRAAEQMFGHSAEEMVDQSLQLLLPPDRVSEESELLARIATGETLEHFQTERLCKDGRRITVSVSMSPIRDAGGRVVGASKICRDVSRQKAQEEEIRHLAYFDGLTDLPNRRLLLDRLQHAVELSRRTANGAALLYVDLDGFRSLNQQHGPQIGDLYLKHAARTIQGRVRSSDTVARLSNDEFVVLCENLGADHPRARDIAHMLATSIEQLLERPCDLDGLAYTGGASVGIQVFIGGAQSAQELLQRADAAMYRRKEERAELRRAAAGAAPEQDNDG